MIANISVKEVVEPISRACVQCVLEWRPVTVRRRADRFIELPPRWTQPLSSGYPRDSTAAAIDSAAQQIGKSQGDLYFRRPYSTARNPAFFRSPAFKQYLCHTLLLIS